MKNIHGWAAAAAVIGVLGACSSDDTTATGTGTTTSTTAGAGGSDSTTGTGGTGGSGQDSGMCAPSANPTACETCAFSKCMTETCACMANADCNGALGDFLTCLSDADGGGISDCSTTFSINANADMVGGGLASTLASCMTDCEDQCKM